MPLVVGNLSASLYVYKNVYILIMTIMSSCRKDSATVSVQALGRVLTDLRSLQKATSSFNMDAVSDEVFDKVLDFLGKPDWNLRASFAYRLRPLYHIRLVSRALRQKFHRFVLADFQRFREGPPAQSSQEQ